MANSGIKTDDFIGGIGLSSYIRPKAISDTYPTHLANLARGGVHSVRSIAERDAITEDRRQPYMLCVVGDVGGGVPKLYWLLSETDLTNASWSEVPLGLSINGALNFLGFLDGTAPTIVDGTGVNGDTYIVDVAGVVNDPNIFNGVETTLTVADYVIYDGTNHVWYHIARDEFATVTWETLTGKPSTFAPSPHTHTVADITDFPNLSEFITTASVVSVIDSETPDNRLAQVIAIKNYIAEEVNNIVIPDPDLSEYYTKTEVDNIIDSEINPISFFIVNTIADLGTIADPRVGDLAHVEENKSIYRYEAGSPDIWVLKYRTALTNAEVKTAYEANTDTNAFTDADKAKLDGLLNLTSNAQIIDLVIDDNVTATDSTWSSTKIQIELDNITAGGGESISINDSEYRFNTGTDATDPGVGIFKANNADLSLATELYVDQFNNNNLDGSLYLGNLVQGAKVMIQEKDNPANQHIYAVNAASTDNTGWFTIPVTHESGTGTISLNQPIIVSLLTGAGGGGELPTNLAVIDADNNFTASQTINGDVLIEPEDDASFLQGLIIKRSGVSQQSYINGRGGAFNFLSNQVFKFKDLNAIDILTLSPALISMFTNLTVDGTGSFTGTVSGADAVDADDFVTKSQFETGIGNGTENRIPVYGVGGTFLENGSLNDNGSTVTVRSGIDFIVASGDVTVFGAGSFTGTVSGADAVNADDFVTKSQLEGVGGSTPVVEAPATFSVDGDLSLDLDTFDFKQALTLDANITTLTPSNGDIGKTYRIELVQGTGGTLTLEDTGWAADTSYNIGDRILYNSIVYKANTAHTSNSANFLVDIANWDIYIECRDGVVPILSSGTGVRDYISLFVSDIDKYELYPDYQEALDGTEGVVDTSASQWVVPGLEVQDDQIEGTSKTVTISNIVEQSDLDAALIPTVTTINHTVAGDLALNLSTFDYVEVTVDANITSVTITNGVRGKKYEVKFIQGSTGGTLLLNTSWAVSTAYSINEERVLPDNQLYVCSTAHTSASDEASIDYSNWTLKYRRPGQNLIVLSSAGSDTMLIAVENTDLYRLEMTYA